MVGAGDEGVVEANSSAVRFSATRAAITATDATIAGGGEDSILACHRKMASGGAWPSGEEVREVRGMQAVSTPLEAGNVLCLAALSARIVSASLGRARVRTCTARRCTLRTTGFRIRRTGAGLPIAVACIGRASHLRWTEAAI